MRKFALTIAIISLVASYFTIPSAVNAQDGQLRPADDNLFESVSMDCLDVKMKLSAVHQQDGLLRVNSGSAYDNISNKLIARFNSRVASENLDGADLIASASGVREELEGFNVSYQLYERAMNQLLKSDCQSRQHQFYQDLLAVQQMRSEVYGSMNRTNQSIDNYFTAFESFKQAYLKQLAEEERLNDEG